MVQNWPVTEPTADAQKAPSGQQQADATPFRFYDNRQKYLAFINTCNEKAVIAAKARREIVQGRPRPPALRIFDAGVGDATVLSRLLRTVHRRVPDRAAARRRQGDQPRGRTPRARQAAGPLPRAPAHGDRDHEPQVRRRPAAAAGRSRRGGPARLARGRARGHLGVGSTTSRSRRWLRSSPRAGGRGRAPGPATR